MSSSQPGIGEKLIEAGASTVKAGVNEVKTTVATAVEQVTGQSKSDSELRTLAQADKSASTERIGQIQKELATQQKIRRFQEVREMGATSTLPASHPSHQENPRNMSEIVSQTQKPIQPLSVKQSVGKAEQGRNFKG